ncbi:MAG TPA: putative glycolipid-binding domain-containing protein [Ktedonobacterales bacterium]|nr:putative glycolipid-binding domain-containing protein [Ktedonobacterales bacterium]
MESHVLWVPWAGAEAGWEHLHLREHDEGAVADGVVLNSASTAPFRLWYQVQTDRAWRVNDCRLQLIGDIPRILSLRTDGAGHWTDDAGVPYPALDGCIDVDVSQSPFTNTLPIRRLALRPGQSADVLVAYVSVPGLSVRPARQRYTCLEQTADGGLYRYENLESGFTADLRVDAQGLVLEYPGYWKRVQNSSSFLPQTPDPLDGALFAQGPAPELADHLQLFGQFVGAWDCQWTGYPSAGPIQTGSGEILFAWVLEGRAVQDLWIFPSRDERRRAGLPADEYGTTVRFYDDTIDAWRSVWTGPVGRNAQVMIARAAGEEIVVEGTNRHGHPLRWIFSAITDQSFHWRNLVSEDGGQSWRMQEELDARRVTPALALEQVAGRWARHG